jgi:ArsR family transcriptional regulator
MSRERSCPEAEIFTGDLEAEARLFKALADPARLRILATLSRADDAVCVCDFTSALGLNQSTVSHHLKLLRDADLVRSERRGTWAYYSLTPGASASLSAALEAVVPTSVRV